MRHLRTVALGFAGAGLLWAAITWFVAQRVVSFRERAVRASGRVVSQEVSHGSEKDSNGFSRETTLYAPVVEYDAPDGKRTFVGAIRANPPSFAIGQRVRVLYLAGPAASADARIDSFGQNWFLAIVFGALSFIFLGVAAIVGARYLRHRPAPG